MPAGRPRVRLKSGASADADLPVLTASAHTAASLEDPFLRAWTPLAGSADADLIPELGAIVPRARDLVCNNGIAAGANQTYKNNIVGHVLRLASKPCVRLLGWEPERSAEWARAVEAEFCTWSETTRQQCRPRHEPARAHQPGDGRGLPQR